MTESSSERIESNVERRVTIAGRRFVRRAGDVRGAVRDMDPEPIASHYVVIGTRQFPPKQVISAVTGVDRADFTTHQARRILMRLGFPARRRGARASGLASAAVDDRLGRPALEQDDEPLAVRLRPLAGRWVAIKDDDILHATVTPQRLVGWLAEHGQRADSVFRVPEDDLAATGLAPL